MTKYYKKGSPKQAVYVRGTPIKFDVVNIELGIFQTNDEGIQSEFAALFARGVGGVFEITVDEYNALAQKKTPTNSQNGYRDVFAKGATHQRIPRPDNDLVTRAEGEASNAAEPAQSAPAATAVTPSAKPLPRQRS